MNRKKGQVIYCTIVLSHVFLKLHSNFSNFSSVSCFIDMAVYLEVKMKCDVLVAHVDCMWVGLSLNNVM